MKLRPAQIFHCAFGVSALLWVSARLHVTFHIPKLAVGPQTTVVTGPLKPNGTVDFETAIHQRFSVGVTPENNAVVLLQNAFGPIEHSVEVRRRAYAYLGLSEPPAFGDYWVSEEDISRKWKLPTRAASAGFWVDFDECRERPWSRCEFPQVADWLNVNERPLELIEQASKRPKYYDPFIIDENLAESFSARHSTLSKACRLVQSRAMLRISEGDYEGAANDLLTCHRLGRLSQQDSDVYGHCTGVALETGALRHAEILLAQPLSSGLIQRLRAAIAALPDPQTISDAWDRQERFRFLATIQAVWTGDYLLHPDFDKVRRYLRFDINVAMRQSNALFDATVEAQQADSFRQRMDSIKKIHTEIYRNANDSIKPQKMLGRFVWETGPEVSEETANLIFACLSDHKHSLQTRFERGAMQRDLLKVGLALATYRAQHGKYPEKLTALSPEILEDLPLDRFNGLPLHYRTTANGYLLYSVGPDEKDNGGAELKGEEGDVSFEVTHNHHELQ